MGFGTLFFGYILLLSLGYYSFTDMICALIMLFGFYKMSNINKGFKLASYSAMIFSIYGLFELGFAIFEMFFAAATDFTTLYSYISMFRNLIICTLSIFMLIGMRDVSYEVGLKIHGEKCQRFIYGTFVIYLINIAMETPAIVGWIDIKILSVISALVVLSKIILTLIILYAIFYCYSHIVLPCSNDDYKEKESKFAFVNAHRKHVEEKQREYAEYKLKKAAERIAKGKQKNGKNK